MCHFKCHAIFLTLIVWLFLNKAAARERFPVVGSRLKEELESEERNAICCAKKMKCCRSVGAEPNIEIRAVLVRCPSSSSETVQPRNFKTLVSSNREENLKKFPGFDEDEPLMQAQIKSCNRKLVITMKIDNRKHISKKQQFVIIDHVFDPVTDKSQRLLNPYVIKLKQEHVTQMYGMKFLNYVNSEAKEVVYNKHMSNYTGCSTDKNNPTCGVVTYNDRVIPFSEGFCCSCDSLINTKRQPKSTSSVRQPVISYTDPAFLMDGVECPRRLKDNNEGYSMAKQKNSDNYNNDESISETDESHKTDKNEMSNSDSLLDSSDDKSNIGNPDSEDTNIDKFVDNASKEDGAGETLINSNTTPGPNPVDQSELAVEPLPKISAKKASEDNLGLKYNNIVVDPGSLLYATTLYNLTQSTTPTTLMGSMPSTVTDPSTTEQVPTEGALKVSLKTDENDEMVNSKHKFDRVDEAVYDDMGSEVLNDGGKNIMQRMAILNSGADERASQQKVNTRDGPWNNNKKQGNLDENVLDDKSANNDKNKIDDRRSHWNLKKQDAQEEIINGVEKEYIYDRRAKRSAYYRTLDIPNDVELENEDDQERSDSFGKRQISSGGSQIRGGQICANRYTPPGMNPETYHESTHCLRFSEIWYAVYELTEPIVEHSIKIQVFEKCESGSGRTKWRDVTGGRVAHLGTLTPHFEDEFSTVSINYNSKYMKPTESRYALNYKAARLLVPEGVDKCDLNKYPELKGGPSEYLIVHPDLISIDGDRCNVAGVGFEAFYNQPNRCGVPKGSCLANQPKSLWKHDHKAEKLHRKGCFFLKHYGTIPENPIRKNGTDQLYLSLQYSGMYSSMIDMEINADSNAALRPSSSALITEVYVDSTSATKTIITVKVTNGGLISSTFLTKLNDCPMDLPASFNNIESKPVLIAPQHQHVYTLELRGRLTSDIFHCSVEVMNQNFELIALRRVKIQKSDRCICTWHCLCACIGSSDGLKCKPMSVQQYHAAGFQGTLPIATAIVQNTVLNDILEVLLFCTIFMILTLLFLGLTKAIIGLCCCSPIGMWGLCILLDLPKRMNRYYEIELITFEVEYDEYGWPIHPENKRRVRNIGKTLEFCTNVLFFFTYPIVVLVLLCKRLCCPYYTYEKDYECPYVKRKMQPKASDTSSKTSSRDEDEGNGVREADSTDGVRKRKSKQSITSNDGADSEKPKGLRFSDTTTKPEEKAMSASSKEDTDNEESNVATPQEDEMEDQAEEEVQNEDDREEAEPEETKDDPREKS